MGYSYDDRGRLACDACGSCGTTRKRTCPYKVHYAEGGSLPYCYPSALCKTCYDRRRDTLHVGCKEGAAKRTMQEAERASRLQAGEYEVKSAYGAWCASVPAGYIGVRFEGVGGTALYKLVPAADYDPGARHYLSDYPAAIEWSNPDLTPKGVRA